MLPAIFCRKVVFFASCSAASKFGGGTDIRDGQTRVFKRFAGCPETYQFWNLAKLPDGRYAFEIRFLAPTRARTLSTQDFC